MFKPLFKKINKKYFFVSLFFLFFVFFQGAFASDFFSVNTLIEFLIWILDFLRYLAALVFQVSATVFDNLLLISLNAKILDQSFVKVVWSSLRDLANTVFVVGGIYLALSYMTGFGRNIEKNIIYLIIAIFALNFSLFASRLIVDAGNLTATVFYSPMAVKVVSDNGENQKEVENYFLLAKTVYEKTGMTKKEVDKMEFRSVGLALYSLIEPTNDIAKKQLDAFKAKTESNSGASEQEQKSAQEQKESLEQQYLVFSIFIVIIYVYFAKEFFIAAFMFIGRLAGLMYLMVSSPIWFAAIFIPKYGPGTFTGKWLYPILQKSFCIAVYMFFLWLAILILASDLFKSINSVEGFSGVDESIIAFVLSIVLKVVFAGALMKQARKFGEKFCEGEFGSTFGHLMKPLGVVAGGAWSATKFAVNPFASAGTAMLRRGVGTVGKKLGESETLGKAYAEGGLIGFGAGRLMVSGKKLQDIKIGKKSDREDQNERIKRLNEIQEGLSKDNQEILMKNRYKKEKLNSDYVKNFVDAEKDKKYQDLLTKKAGVGENGPLSKAEREKAKKEADEMIKNSKISEMGIKNEALKGSGLAAALIPALGAQKNRAMEYNEGRLKAAGKNPEIEKAGEKRKELTKRRAAGEEKIREEKEKIQNEVLSGDFDGNGYDDMDEETVEQLKELNESLSSEKKEGEKNDTKITEYEEKIIEIEEANQDLLNDFLSSESRGAKSFSDDVSDKIKDTLGDSGHSDFMQKQDDLYVQMEEAKHQMDIAGKNGDTAGLMMHKDTVESMLSQIQKERQKVAAEIKKANENDVVYKEQKELKNKAEKNREKINSNIKGIEKEVKATAGYYEKQKNAQIKAEYDQKTALLNQMVQGSEQAKRNAIAKAKEGDVAGITAADAQIDTL